MCIAGFITMYLVVSPCFATICTSVACVIAIAWHVMLIDSDCFHGYEITIFLILHCVGARKTPALPVLLLLLLRRRFTGLASHVSRGCCSVACLATVFSPCLLCVLSSLSCNSDVFHYVIGVLLLPLLCYLVACSYTDVGCAKDACPCSSCLLLVWL